MDLDELTVFNDLRERLKAITPEQMQAVERKLTNDKQQKKEKVIGVVESPATRGLWVLASLLHADHLLEHAKAATTTDETVEKDHNERAALLDMLADVARELFWAQAKVDLAFYKEASIGVRAGWSLVERPDPGGPAGFITQMMGGIPQIPEE